MASQQKRIKRIVSSRKRRDVQIRRLYREIDSGARTQQRLHSVFERRFFDASLKEGNLVAEAARFQDSRRQNIELRTYANRLERARKAILERYARWGIEERHSGKPMERTPSGTKASTIFFQLSGWLCSEPVLIIPERGFMSFVVGKRDYKDMTAGEFREGSEITIVFTLPIFGGATSIIISPDIATLRKHFEHEKMHTTLGQLPLTREIFPRDRQLFNPRTLEQGFYATNLAVGSRAIGRNLVDELIGNLLEPGGIKNFEENYKTPKHLSGSSYVTLGPKTARAFMANKHGLKRSVLDAAAKSIKAVKKALAESVVNPQTGERVKVIDRRDLAALLANIRDIHKVPVRLPVLTALRKRQLERRLGAR